MPYNTTKYYRVRLTRIHLLSCDFTGALVPLGFSSFRLGIPLSFSPGLSIIAAKLSNIGLEQSDAPCFPSAINAGSQGLQPFAESMALPESI